MLIVICKCIGLAFGSVDRRMGEVGNRVIIKGDEQGRHYQTSQGKMIEANP